MGTCGPEWVLRSVNVAAASRSVAAERASLAAAALKLAEQELGAGPLEGHRQALMLAHRLFYGGACCVQIPASGKRHGTAAGADGQHPGTVQATAVAFESLDERLSFGEALEVDHGFDGVGHERGATARTGIQNESAQFTVSVQGCRKKDLESDWCGPWADYVFKPPVKPAAPPPVVAPPPVAAPAPVVVPDPPKIAPTNAVTMNISVSGLNANIDIASTAEIPGTCTHKATAPLLPTVDKSKASPLSSAASSRT